MNNGQAVENQQLSDKQSAVLEKILQDVESQQKISAMQIEICTHEDVKDAVAPNLITKSKLLLGELDVFHATCTLAKTEKQSGDWPDITSSAKGFKSKASGLQKDLKKKIEEAIKEAGKQLTMSADGAWEIAVKA